MGPWKFAWRAGLTSGKIVLSSQIGPLFKFQGRAKAVEWRAEAEFPNDRREDHFFFDHRPNSLSLNLSERNQTTYIRLQQ